MAEDRARRPGRGWAGGSRVADLGEFAIIAQLRAWIARGGSSLARSGTALLRVGPGDDAAVLRVAGRHDLVWTCDIQIEGRHFLADWMGPEEVGARAAEINLSDLAAMGAEPVAALVSLGLPPDLRLGALERIYRGLDRSLSRWGAGIAGGNITRADQLLLDIALLGRIERGRALLRSAARPGDIVFVTGRPGRSAAALMAGRTRARVPERVRSRLRPAYVAPRARVGVGRYLITNGIRAAVIDQSDGLAGDLRHICEESQAGVVLMEALLPQDPDLVRLAGILGRDPLEWVLGPSDDYELICAVPRRQADAVFAIPSVLGIPVAAIGEVVRRPHRVVLHTRTGADRELGAGWDHFARDGRA